MGFTITGGVTLSGGMNFSSPPGIVTDNLVLYYDPSNTSSYPGSGSTVYDLSGNGLDGTLTNVTYSSPSFVFDWPGTNAYITVADNPLLEPGAGSYSIEIWYRYNLQGGNQYLLSKWATPDSFSNLSYAATRTFGDATFSWWASGGTGVQNTQIGLSSETWYQTVYVLSRSPSNLYAYVNGSLVRTNAHTLDSINNTNTPLYLGGRNGATDFYSGRIGIVRLYNTALSLAQVQQNWNVNRSKYGL
jgi:hypothetical protein